MRFAPCAGFAGRGPRCRESTACRRLGLLGRYDHRSQHRRPGCVPPSPRKGLRQARGLVSGLRQRHAGREKRRRQGRVRAPFGGRGAGRRRRRGQFKRQLRQARRHRQGRDDLLCGSLQDGLLQPGRVVREFGLGDRRLQRRHFRRPADQDAGAGRNLYADSRREPPDHARPERSLRIELHARHVAQLDPGVEGRGFGHGGPRGHHGADQPRTPQADGRRAAVREPLPRRRIASRGQCFDGLSRDEGQETVERHSAPRFDGHRRPEDGPQPRRLPRPAEIRPDQRGQQVALCRRQRHAGALGLEVRAGESSGRHARLQEHPDHARGDGEGLGLAGRRQEDAALRFAHPQPQRQWLF